MVGTISPLCLPPPFIVPMAGLLFPPFLLLPFTLLRLLLKTRSPDAMEHIRRRGSTEKFRMGRIKMGVSEVHPFMQAFSSRCSFSPLEELHAPWKAFHQNSVLGGTSLQMASYCSCDRTSAHSPRSGWLLLSSWKSLHHGGSAGTKCPDLHPQPDNLSQC